jgi:hypothetical protein
MKYMQKSFLQAACMALLGLAACQNNNPEQDARTQAEILAPLQNQEIAYGEVLDIRALLRHPIELHAYTITIKAMPKDSAVYFVYGHQHARELEVQQVWQNLMDYPSDMQLELITFDHNNFVDTTRLRFKAVVPQ